MNFIINIIKNSGDYRSLVLPECFDVIVKFFGWNLVPIFIDCSSSFIPEFQKFFLGFEVFKILKLSLLSGGDFLHSRSGNTE